MRTIGIDKIDTFLTEIDEAYARSHDEAYKLFRSTELSPPENCPSDPFSDEYRNMILDLYERVSNRDGYETDNEVSGFDIDELFKRPYPFSSKSTKLTSEYYNLMGKMLGHLDIPAGGDILECGFGWGHTTLTLAMLGYNVTALDINENFCELVERRKKQSFVENVDIICDDFLCIENEKRTFDAVIFFESFHHCWEFERLLRAIRRVVKPGGKVYFAAEPINDIFPIPWTVRLDGESLFVARTHGWMELGFTTDYFQQLLLRTGWFGRELETHFWVATTEPPKITVLAKDDKLFSQVGQRVGDHLQIESPRLSRHSPYALYGPYIALQKGRYAVEVTMDHVLAGAGGRLEVVYDEGRTIMSQKEINRSDFKAGALQIEFEAKTRTEGVEVRLLTYGKLSARVHKVEFTPVLEPSGEFAD